MYDRDHHDNDHGDANDYAYKYQYLLQQQVSNNEGSIHNNKVGDKVRTRVNTHIELWVLIQPQLPLLLLLHL